MHTIRMTLELSRCMGMDQRTPERFAEVCITVDGTALDIGAGWDFLALVASAQVPGGYYLGNCGCGVPECGGIYRPVAVRHDGGRLTWTIPQPYTQDKGAPQGPDFLDFDADQYRAEAAGLVAQLDAASKDGGPTVRLDCYPGNLPAQLLARAAEGWAGYADHHPLPD